MRHVLRLIKLQTVRIQKLFFEMDCVKIQSYDLIYLLVVCTFI